MVPGRCRTLRASVTTMATSRARWPLRAMLLLVLAALGAPLPIPDVSVPPVVPGGAGGSVGAWGDASRRMHPHDVPPVRRGRSVARGTVLHCRHACGRRRPQPGRLNHRAYIGRATENTDRPDAAHQRAAALPNTLAGFCEPSSSAVTWRDRPVMEMQRGFHSDHGRRAADRRTLARA